MRIARKPRSSQARVSRRELCELLESRILFAMSFTINYDKTVTALPNFNTISSAVNNAVTQLSTAFTNPIKIIISVVAGTPAAGVAGPIGNGTATLASAIPTYQGVTYPALVTALETHHTTLDRQSAVSTLPLSNPTGAGSFTLATAEAKALGIKTTAKSDGTFTFNSAGNYTYNSSQRGAAGKVDFIGMVIDGFTKIMGRAAGQGSGTTPTYHPLDLFRFTGPGVHSYSSDTSYFSVDNGTTNLNFYSDNNDAADWATDPMTPVPDAFNDDTGTGRVNNLTEADRKEMDVLGYIRSDAMLLPDHLAFVNQPVNMLVGLMPPIQVELLDINNTLSLTDGDLVDLEETNGLVSLNGAQQVPSVQGIVTFNNVTITTPGTFLTLTAVDETSGLVSAKSQTFGVFTLDTYLTTHTTLSTLPNPSTYGQDVVLTATVGSTVTPSAGGLVDFFDNGQLLGTTGTDGLGAASIDVFTLAAGVHAITASYEGDIGFNPSQSAFTVQTVNKATLTVVGMNAVDKVYDGTTSATLGTGLPLLVGVVGLDDVGVDASGATGTFVSKAAGTGVTVNINGLMLTGTTAGNYTFVAPTTFANITPRPLAAVGVTVADKLFDGTPGATILTRTLTGVVPGDVAIPIGGTATFSDSAVGNNKLVNISSLTLTGANASSYIISPTATAHASILSTSPPLAPFGVTSAAQSATAIRTTWNLNGNLETSVRVVRWTGTSWQSVGTLPAGSTSFTEFGLPPNHTFIYDVVAVNSFGTTFATAYSSATTAILTAPVAPSGVTATTLSANAVRVNWTLNGGSESSVTVVRWNGTAWVALATLAAGSTTYTDTTALPLTNYLYDVYASNAAGTTWAASFANATTLSAPVAAPAAPSGITATPINSNTAVRVNWTLNGGSEQQVYVAKWNGTSFQVIAVLPVGTTTYTDNSVVHGANLYIVIAANQFGQTFAATYGTAIIP